MTNLLMATTGGAIVDLIAISLIVILTVIGIKDGFVKTFISTFGWLLSFILSALLCSVVASFLERQHGLATQIAGWLEGAMTQLFGDEIVNTTLEQATQAGLENGGLAFWIISIILSLKGSATIPTDVTLNQILTPALAYYILCAISFVILFVLFLIAFFIIGDLSKKLHDIKLTAFLDKALGGVLSFVQAILLIDLIVIIINAIPIAFVQDIAFEINNSVVTSFLCSINVLGLLFDFITNNGIIEFIQTIFK